MSDMKCQVSIYLTNSTYEVELGNVEIACKNKAFIFKNNNLHINSRS